MQRLFKKLETYQCSSGTRFRLQDASSNKYARGFTIVELLIVIVVIGILAAITIVAYNGIQSRARDTRVKDAAAKVAEAVQLWSINRDGQLPTGAGYPTTVPVANGVCTGGGGGWAATGVHPCTLEDMLVDSKLLPVNFITSLPPNKNFGGATNGVYTMMFYNCGGSNFFLFYSLENPTAQDTSDVNNATTACGVSFIRDSYGMRGAKALSF